MQKTKTLKTAIVYRLLAAAFITIAIAGFLSYSYLTKNTHENIQTKNELLAKAIAGEVSGLLREPYAVLSQTTSFFSSHTHSWDETNSILDSVIATSGFFESILVLNRDGIITSAGLAEEYATHLDDFIGLDFSGQKFFKETQISKVPTWSDIFLSIISGRVSLTLSFPIDSHIFVGSFSIEHLHDVTAEIKAGENIQTAIIDNKGVLVFHSNKVNVAQHLNLGSITPVQKARMGQLGTYDYVLDGIAYIGSVSKIPETGWLILVSQKYEDAYAPVRKATNIYILGMIAFTLVVGGLALAFAARVTAPLSYLRESTSAIADGQYDTSIPAQQYEEFEDLAKSFRHMASALHLREEALHESEEKFRSLVESMKTIPWKLDVASGRFTYMGQQVEAISGYPSETWIDVHTWTDRMHPDDQERAASYCLEASGRGEDHEIEYRMVTADGSIVWIRDIVSVIMGNDGPRELAGFMINITEQKESEEALRQSEDKFSKAFRSSPTFITITTMADGQFIDVNDSFYKTSGYTREEVIGHTDLELRTWVRPEHREDIARLLKEDGEVINFESQLRMKSGEILSVLHSAEIINIDSKQCILGVTLDITDRKKLEAQLLHSQKLEAVGQLAGGVAHEFNNILTAIIGYSYLLKGKIKADEKEMGSVTKILELSNRAAHITRGLLTFSRKHHSKFVPVKINEIIKNVDMFLSKLIGEDIDVKKSLTDSELTIEADSVQIEQIIINLATNARDSMPNGGTLTIETKTIELNEQFKEFHDYDKPGMYAVIRVSDTGSGMDAETKERIFEPFFTTKEVGKGTGLGLSMVYGIVKQHGGYINVYSEPGIGSTFNIYLPEIKAAVKMDKETVTPDLKGKSETLLLAEDESAVRHSLKCILEEFNYSVIEAVDGKDAVEKFIEHRDEVQLLILDVVMPGMNGKDAFDQIRKIAPHVKAIFTSGYTADIIRSKNVLEEDVPFISKPILLDKFLLKVKEVLKG